MIRRAFFVTAVAVVLSAAGALAFAPDIARATHRWSFVGWQKSGFTAVPRAPDTAAVTRDPSAMSAEGGTPGTYCPIRRDSAGNYGKTSARSEFDLELSRGRSAQTTPDSGGAAPAMCSIPSGTPSKPILP